MNVLTPEFMAIASLLLVLLGLRFGKRASWLDHTERVLGHVSAAWVVGLASSATVWWVWGSLNQVPVVSDESSYLLQANLFASGRWSAPTPDLSQFFEQAHVILTPAFASKYPPGHALVLTPGVLLGLSGLVPVVLSGISGALIFVLVRRISNAWVAVLTWLFWLTTFGNLYFRPSYYSEVTTSVLWLGGWWALLNWSDTGRQKWLISLGAIVGMGLITRPLTMLAYALPIAAFVLWRLIATRSVRTAILPVMTSVCFLAILPVWSFKTTGSWSTNPLTIYTATYIPWDIPGFGLVETPPIRAVPDDMQRVFDGFVEVHRQHTISDLPRIGIARLSELGTQLWSGWRFWFLPLALIGALTAGSAGTLALASSVTLFVAYLLYAHPAQWALYYLEAFPVVAFLGATGTWRAIRILSNAVSGAAPGEDRTVLAVLLLIPLFMIGSINDMRGSRSWLNIMSVHQRSFAQVVSLIKDSRAVIFVRYSADHEIHNPHVSNEADLEAARVWLVHDRGIENDALRASAPDRIAYLFDEGARTLARLAPLGSPKAVAQGDHDVQ